MRRQPSILIRTVEAVVGYAERVPMTYGLWISGFMALVVARFMLEHALSDFEIVSTEFLFVEFMHFFLSFLFTTLLFLFFVMHRFRAPLRLAATLALFGFTLVLTPPIVDTVVTHGNNFTIFYKLDGLTGWSDGHGLPYRFLTFFGDRPDFGVTFGMRVEIALAVLFLAAYAWVKFRRLVRTVSTALLAYSIFFLLGTTPSWVTILAQGWQKGFLAVSDVTIATFISVPRKLWSQPASDLVVTANLRMDLIFATLITILLVWQVWWLFRGTFRVFWKNARFPQLFYHSGLVCVGMGLAGILTGSWPELGFFNILSFLILQTAVWAAWLASVVANDVFDRKIDEQTNPGRPLPSGRLPLAEYQAFGWTFFTVSVVWAAVANYKAALFIIGYQAVAWLYSAPPLRLKRIPFLGTFVAALASLLLFFLGFVMVSPDETLQKLPAAITLHLLAIFTFVLATKDFKDIQGDRTDKVYTLPVILGEEWARLVIGGALWVAYSTSILVFHEPRLFLPSLFFGALSFVLVMTAGKGPWRKWVTFRSLPLWIFLSALGYGLSIARMILNG